MKIKHYFILAGVFVLFSVFSIGNTPYYALTDTQRTLFLLGALGYGGCVIKLFFMIDLPSCSEPTKEEEK